MLISLTLESCAKVSNTALSNLKIGQPVTKCFICYSSGVSGEPYGLRLVGGVYEWEGRVEVSVNGEWGTVCSLDISTSDGNVICRQLGYQRSLSE